MPDFSFQISARLMSHLGEALISDELVALLELIKNSYDADANKSIINIDTNYFDERGIGKIEIIDDGNGMNIDVIENSFLKLATDFKIKSQKVSPKFNRMALGNKGVGRLSLQRLGKFAIVTTNDGNKEYSFKIKWDDFNNDIDIQNVKINVYENENHVINMHGTKIEIFSLKNIELWKNKDTFLRFKNEIISMINPYETDRTKFLIYFNLDEYRFASDKYDINYIEKLSDSIVNFEYKSKQRELKINIERKKKYADYRLDEAKKRYNNLDFDFEEIDKNAKYTNLKQTYIIDLDNISKSYNKLKYNLLIKNDDGKTYLPGDFEGRYYSFDKSAGRLTKEDKIFLDNINGVKLFRNNFRILPYGNKDAEWLDFTKYSQTYSSNIYKAHSVAGYIYINGEENLAKLREMTNRQGLLEDNYGKNFLIILRDIISKIIVDSDVKFRDEFVADLSEINNAKSGDKVKLIGDKVFLIKREDYAQNILQDSKTLSSKVSTDIFDSKEIAEYKSTLGEIAKSINENAKRIKDTINSEKIRINDEEKMLEKYKIVMANSIIAESLAHEILKIALKTKNCAVNIRNEMSKKNPNMQMANGYVDMIISSTQFLYRNASILDSNSYIKKNYFEIVDIKSLLTNIVNTFPLFDSEVNNKCKINLIGDSFSINIIKNNFIVTIENLLINSKYWLEKNEISNPMIYIQLEEEKVILFDNGYGISRDVENNIFDAFVTAKPNSEGRGLGLYIAKQLINEIGGNIILDVERNKYGNRYKFIISF